MPELVNILRFEEKNLEILEPVSTGECEKAYPTWAEEFVLSVITLQQETSFLSKKKRSVEIMICVDGSAMLMDMKTEKQVVLSKGQSVIIPASTPRYRMAGEGIFYKAGVPDFVEISSGS
ncbi:MAG: hypothetical protein EHJ94_08835 [Deltaproteobacteria bacterium]|nr:MAG: hypothetical protein EHJ94_08835 [Deltaproteobacteria bacterium]